VFKKFIRPLITMFVVIVLPVIAFSYFTNLPAAQPPIPSYYSDLGYSSVSGEQLETYLEGQPDLLTESESIAVACPTVLIVSQSEPGLCGYCKLSDVVIYPFWQDGFQKKIAAAEYDYRYFYVDALRTRYVSLKQTDAKPFEVSKSNGQWRESYGRWFKCQNAEHLDINAYVEIYEDKDASNKLRISYKVGNYETLGQVRPQIKVAAPSKN
jgi:hypothetical protein